jgi:hypothetical protein
MVVDRPSDVHVTRHNFVLRRRAKRLESAEKISSGYEIRKEQKLSLPEMETAEMVDGFEAAGQEHKKPGSFVGSPERLQRAIN